jgi:hypothetical protein
VLSGQIEQALASIGECRWMDVGRQRAEPRQKVMRSRC